MIRRRKRDNFERRQLHLLLQVVPIVVVGAVFIAGCAAPSPVYSVKSNDPTVKIPAIRIAVQRGDRSVVPELIKDLDSDDPAVRFYADDGLKKLTGQDFGFQYYADDHPRESAVQRWQTWLEQTSLAGPHQPAAAQSGPATQTGSGDSGATTGPSTQDVR